MSQPKKHWYDYLWIASALYLILGFFNILFAWLGLLCFFIPLILAVAGFDKAYCNRYCGRGQLFSLLGGKLGLSRKKSPPKFLSSKGFRYGFLIFFFIMFFQMLWTTWLVFDGANDLKQVVTLLWTFRLPWNWAYHGTVFAPWVAQFAFGFYSVMLTSTVLGIITMALFKPRSWCVYCPMGTMTQLICKAKNGKTVSLSQKQSH
ncbi:MAG: 4Fe-4S binding protein [Massiliimalia sp.]|jgi:hypothetical protein